MSHQLWLLCQLIIYWAKPRWPAIIMIAAESFLWTKSKQDSKFMGKRMGQNRPLEISTAKKSKNDVSGEESHTPLKFFHIGLSDPSCPHVLFLAWYEGRDLPQFLLCIHVIDGNLSMIWSRTFDMVFAELFCSCLRSSESYLLNPHVL